ncbi:MAG: tRNA (adenosine(37)-N6)-threonylcarbamoyltransferase complex transferase subunit TsaD [Saprospiraceae bacterium]|jgi:N6-L-threonylcarbamoyladenine synthase|nr:tRNA (adenosine(37)-N6)-threonylcarbamoyltransferase complex transferase subunit TsaD [Saprospiraceae bacterium]MBP9209670.1 tRNA (adenosine(37)-N6)-threonylcarbamoyltransferase complex transferase subunit TsaD [Saprospiraceae bacterium]MBV6471969.1 tRNA N6-adenosine threonylcarbamoyltransferase [Saprospiraceae bacterium]
MVLVEGEKIYVLGIETSCDDTSVAIVCNGAVLVNLTTSQWIHEKFGGVVPEYASRFHVEAIAELAGMALNAAQLNVEKIHAVAVTNGPGLMGSLLVGLSFAKGLCLSLGIPLIAINHLQAHAMSLFIEENASFPLLCLTVSGGHTQLLLMRDQFEMELLGQTLDDAAGEAFDKTGKLLGLPYPAGPWVDKYAALGTATFDFPLAQTPRYDYSFSGIKTSVLYFLRKQLALSPDFIERHRNDLCASIQKAIVKMLTAKLLQAAEAYGVNNIGVAGGVSANSGLRRELNELAEQRGWKLYIPKMAYCTDNAAMIASLGYKKFLRREYSGLETPALARFPVTETQV